MHEDLRAYLINRMEILEEEIGIKEKEYRKIVNMLTQKEEILTKEEETMICSRCEIELPLSAFDTHKNGKMYSCCKHCIAKLKNKRMMKPKDRAKENAKVIKAAVEKPEKKKKEKKLSFEEQMKIINESGLSYKEYQMKETLRLAGMRGGSNE